MADNHYPGTVRVPRGYVDSDKPIGPIQRRSLPEVDLSRCVDDPEWLNWISGHPTVPGWYWVKHAGVWPQIVEYRFVKGKLRAIDKHSDGLWGDDFWSAHAGPIPDPDNSTKRPYKKRGKK